MQAGLSTPATTSSTTSGNGTGNVSSSETTPGGANIDLLAGIDFSPQTPPLVPQTKVNFIFVEINFQIFFFF